VQHSLALAQHSLRSPTTGLPDRVIESESSGFPVELGGLKLGGGYVLDLGYHGVGHGVGERLDVGQ